MAAAGTSSHAAANTLSPRGLGCRDGNPCFSNSSSQRIITHFFCFFQYNLFNDEFHEFVAVEINVSRPPFPARGRERSRDTPGEQQNQRATRRAMTSFALEAPR
jgi:hypothetical protein